MHRGFQGTSWLTHGQSRIISYRSGAVVTMDDLTLPMIIPKVHSLHYGVLHSVSLGEYKMTCNHQCGIIQSIFTA